MSEIILRYVFGVIMIYLSWKCVKLFERYIENEENKKETR